MPAVTEMRPHNQGLSLPLSGVRIHLATGALKPMRVDLLVCGQLNVRGEGPGLFIFKSLEMLLLHVILILKNSGGKYRTRIARRPRKIQKAK